jgi:ubiquinone/menaquinone biosynthesis C-methylase UbiE
MTHQQASHGFMAVDRQPNPARYVQCLDTLHREPFYQAYKARVRALLRPQPCERFLELGGGTGEDARTLAQMSAAQVVMLDLSQTMARAARERGLRNALVGDGMYLPFASASFDGCWADRTFQHLPQPQATLSELVRVLRPGGRMVVVDPDYDTQVVAVADQALAERLRRFRADVALQNGTLAHQMLRLFRAAGLRDVQVEGLTLVVQDPTAVDNVMGLRTWAATAHIRGHLSIAEAAQWEQAIDDAITQEYFLYAVTFFMTSASKPH